MLQIATPLVAPPPAAPPPPPAPTQPPGAATTTDRATRKPRQQTTLDLTIRSSFTSPPIHPRWPRSDAVGPTTSPAQYPCASASTQRTLSTSHAKQAFAQAALE